MRLRTIALALGALLLGGCLRFQYDRCDDDPPHPECADAGLDAAVDAGTDAGIEVDAGPLDGSIDDAATDDAAADDAATDVDAGPIDASTDAG